MPVIEFIKVKKSFGKNIVFADLTLAVERGETIVIMGGSGTGKSVMLKILIGLLPADAGEVRAFDQDILGWSEEALLPIRKRISMLFQGGALFDSINVADNVAYPLREHGELDEATIMNRVATALDRVGLAGSEQLAPADLSGGMRKRAALARAIVAVPEVLLYDEPTTGLDPANTRRICELILSVQKDLGVTSIVVTHDMQCAFMVANRVAMLHEGRIHLVAPVDEFERSEDPVIRDFVHAMDHQTPAHDADTIAKGVR